MTNVELESNFETSQQVIYNSLVGIAKTGRNYTIII